MLEANRRSNLTSLQLYAKEIEASPGESAALSIFSRYLNGQGGNLLLSCKFQVLLVFFDTYETSLYVSQSVLGLHFSFLVLVSGCCEAIVCMERFNG